MQQRRDMRANTRLERVVSYMTPMIVHAHFFDFLADFLGDFFVAFFLGADFFAAFFLGDFFVFTVFVTAGAAAAAAAFLGGAFFFGDFFFVLFFGGIVQDLILHCRCASFMLLRRSAEAGLCGSCSIFSDLVLVCRGHIFHHDTPWFRSFWISPTITVQ